MVRVMVFGASGFLGGHVYRNLVNQGNVDVVGTCGPESQTAGLVPLDLTLGDPVRRLLRDVVPDVIIWCVMARRGDHEIRLSEGGLSTVVHQVGQSTRILFVSTDAVLPGHRGPYGEATPGAESPGTTALDQYINAKIDAERRLGEGAANYCIVRPGPIYGTRVDGRWDGRTRRVLGALGRGESIEQPVNLIRTYSHVEDLAAGLAELTRLPIEGVLHVGSPIPASHWDFATAVAQRAGFSPHLVRGFEISPGEVRERQIRLDTSLDTSRASRCLTTRLRSLDEALAEAPIDILREHTGGKAWESH